MSKQKERAARDRGARQTGTNAEDRERAHLAYVNRGARLLERGRAKQAIPVLEKAYELAPEDAAVCINLGGAYVLAGRHKQAVPVLEVASQVEPDNPMVWVNLAAAYLGNPVLARDEQQDRAIGALQRAVALNPATPNAYYNLGLIHRDRREWAVALDAFEWAVKVNPLDQDARSWIRRLQEIVAEEEGASHGE